MKLIPKRKDECIGGEAPGQYGYTDKDDNWVIEPQFDLAKVFVDGSAIVKKDGKYGVINENGQYIHQPVFNDAYKWEGLIVVNIDDEWGYMDHSGEWLEEPYFGCIQQSKKSNDYLEAWYDGDGFQIFSDGTGIDADYDDEDEDWDDED